MFVQHSTHVKVTKYHKRGKEEYEFGITAKEIRRNSITTAYGFKEIFMSEIFYQFIKQYIFFFYSFVIDILQAIERAMIQLSMS